MDDASQAVIIGDCIDVLKGMQDHTYGFSLFDPPYSRAGACSSGRWNKSSALVGSDMFWGHWFKSVFEEVARVNAEDACALIFTDYRTIGTLEKAINGVLGWAVSQCAVWDREGIGLGSPMRAGHELIAFARGPKFKWSGSRSIGNVFRHRWPYGKHEFHPAEKPVPLLEELCAMFNAEGRPTVDPFTGSGSALVACMNRGINAVGIELDHNMAQTAAGRIGARATMFGPTVARKTDDGKIWLLNKPESGWGSSAIIVDSEAEALDRFGAVVGQWRSCDGFEEAQVRVAMQQKQRPITQGRLFEMGGRG